MLVSMRSLPSLNTSLSAALVIATHKFFDAISFSWSKRTSNPHLRLEFTTIVGVGLLDKPGDGRVLLSEAGEIRGSDSVKTKPGATYAG